MLIPDLKKATPGDIDLSLINEKLWRIKRFQGHPNALVVRQHTLLVEWLCIRGGASEQATIWALHHDDHEALIGDLNGTVHHIIDKETDVLRALTNHLDRCICEARGIDWPTKAIREEVHFYDKLAESIETKYGIEWGVLPGHPTWPGWLTESLARTSWDAHKALLAPHM